MDYLKLIRSFWTLHKREAFTGNETLFYWRLVDLFNEEGEKDVWPDELRFGDGMLCSETGLSPNTIKGSKGVRESLVNRGLIEFEPTGKGYRSGGLYRLVAPMSSSKRSSKRSSKFDELADEVTDELEQKDSQGVGQQLRQKDGQILTNSYIYITKPTKQPNHQTLQKIFFVADRNDVNVWLSWIWLFENKKKEKPPRVPPRPPNIPFQVWYDAYDKKRDPKDCEAEWLKLTDDERTAAMKHTPLYVTSTEKQYRKDPIRYLKKKKWDDEIIERNGPNSQNSTQNASNGNGNPYGQGATIPAATTIRRTGFGQRKPVLSGGGT